MATPDSSQLDRASSSPSFSVNAAGSGSSLSTAASFKSRQDSPSTSTTPLCFGAGGGAAGSGRRLLRGSRARPPAKQPPQEKSAATMAPKVKGDVVGRYLRKISRRPRKARSDGKRSPSSMAAVDDTARERAELVRAISYCKDTLRRGKSRSPSPPPPPPSPSLDDSLDDKQEIIVSAAVNCDECMDSLTRGVAVPADASSPGRRLAPRDADEGQSDSRSCRARPRQAGTVRSPRAPSRTASCHHITATVAMASR